jgi:hypothetical protein
METLWIEGKADDPNYFYLLKKEMERQRMAQMLGVAMAGGFYSGWAARQAYSSMIQASQVKVYINPAKIKTNKFFNKVTPGNPQITAGGQTAKGGEFPCIANSEQIAAMRGYSTNVRGNLKDIVNSSGPIKPGIYKLTLQKTGGYHQVVVNADRTVTDVSLKVNLGELPSFTDPDTWVLSDYSIYH